MRREKSEVTDNFIIIKWWRCCFRDLFNWNVYWNDRRSIFERREFCDSRDLDQSWDERMKRFEREMVDMKEEREFWDRELEKWKSEKIERKGKRQNWEKRERDVSSIVKKKIQQDELDWAFLRMKTRFSSFSLFIHFLFIHHERKKGFMKTTIDLLFLDYFN